MEKEASRLQGWAGKTAPHQGKGEGGEAFGSLVYL